jgi:hypothetical protein
MSSPLRALDALLEAVQRGEEVDPEGLVKDLPHPWLDPLAREAERRLAGLPTPIGRTVQGPAASQHRALRRVLGWVHSRQGDPSLLLEVAREDWLGGGSHARYLRLLMDHGRGSEALAMARTLLEHGDGRDRRELEALMADAAQVPEGWIEAVRAFAQQPSLQAWQELLRFTPQDLIEQRLRYTLALLRNLDVPPDVLFDCATQDGVTSEAIDLAERGLVDPHRIEARAARAPSESAAIWLGLAARAACVRGDRFNTVRLLREVVQSTLPPDITRRDVRFVRSHADDELHALLDSAGLPKA